MRAGMIAMPRIPCLCKADLCLRTRAPGLIHYLAEEVVILPAALPCSLSEDAPRLSWQEQCVIHIGNTDNNWLCLISRRPHPLKSLPDAELLCADAGWHWRELRTLHRHRVFTRI